MSQDDARTYMNEIPFPCADMAAYLATTIFKRDRHPDGTNLLNPLVKTMDVHSI